MQTLIVIDRDELAALVKNAVQETMQQQPKSATLKQFYTLSEAAEVFGTTRKTIERWASLQLIKVTAIGGRRYITGESIARHINS